MSNPNPFDPARPRHPSGPGPGSQPSAPAPGRGPASPQPRPGGQVPNQAANPHRPPTDQYPHPRQYPVPQQQYPAPQDPGRQPQFVKPQFVKPSGTDFTTPVELKCVLDVDKMMVRFIPICLLAGFLGFLLVGIPIGLVADSAVLTYAGGIGAAVVVACTLYFVKRGQVSRTFAEKQRLRLTPHGMVKVDGTVQIDMPWAGLSRVEVRNSALSSGAAVRGASPAAHAANAAIDFSERAQATGLVGRAVISPLPGASRKLLAAHDRSGGSNLRGGQPHQTPDGLIFPAEFELDWVNGEVGAWLRHYRPDLNLAV